MEENLDNHVTFSELGITERSRHYLLYTAKWARFLAIVGIVFCALAALGALVMLITASLVPGMAFMSLVYLVMIVIYIFPIIYMMNFSRDMKLALASGDSLTAERAFEYLKSLFKFMGIFTIVGISLYILAGLFTVGVAAFVR